MTYTPIPAGTPTWDVPLNAALQDLQDQITALNSGTFRPSDHNLRTWSYDPAAMQNPVATTAGTVYLIKVILRSAATVTNVIATVGTAGSTLTSGQNFAGLYTSAGSRIAVTADQSSNWTSIGTKFMALSGGPYSLAAGSYYVALLSNGTTPPQFQRANSVSASALNAGLTAATGRFITTETSQTSLPATTSLAGASTDSSARWVALS